MKSITEGRVIELTDWSMPFAKVCDEGYVAFHWTTKNRTYIYSIHSSISKMKEYGFSSASNYTGHTVRLVFFIDASVNSLFVNPEFKSYFNDTTAREKVYLLNIIANTESIIAGACYID